MPNTVLTHVRSVKGTKHRVATDVIVHSCIAVDVRHLCKCEQARPSLMEFVLCQVTMGINYFGAFYLTHLLLGKLLQQPRSRVVFENSVSEVHGELHWDDLPYAFEPSIALISDASQCLLNFHATPASKLASNCTLPQSQEQVRNTQAECFVAHKWCTYKYTGRILNRLYSPSVSSSIPSGVSLVLHGCRQA